MQKRNLKYFARQKALQGKINEMSNLAKSLSMQASFPDSGYYYAQKARNLNRLHDELKPQIKRDRWKRIWAHLHRERERLEYNYYVKVQVKDRNGRGWTAAEMDEQMVYH